MSTYSDHEQRLLDQQTGAEMDRQAERAARRAGDTIANPPTPLASNERMLTDWHRWLDDRGPDDCNTYAAFTAGFAAAEKRAGETSAEAPALRTDVLAFLRQQKEADVVAAAALAKAGGFEWNENDEAMKSFQKREDLIERLFFATLPKASPELIAEARRQGKLPPADEALEYRLPCNVRLPPSTVITRGCSLRTLLEALRQREGLPEEPQFIPEASGNCGPNTPWDRLCGEPSCGYCGLRRAPETSAPLRAVPDNHVAKALTDLVRLKDIKERWEMYPAGVIPKALYDEYGEAQDAYVNDYQKNRDAAWDAARRALKATAPLIEKQEPLT